MNTLRLSVLVCGLAMCVSTVPAQAAFTAKKPITNKPALQGMPGLTCKPVEVPTIVKCTWPRYSISFLATNNLTISEGDDRQSVSMLGSQSDVLMSKSIATFVIQITVRDLPTPQTLQQLDAKFRAEAAYNNSGDDPEYYAEFHLNDVVPAELMGLSGNRYTFTAESQDTKFNYIDYHLLQGQREYRILFRSIPEHYEKNRVMFQAIADSIALTTAASSSSSVSTQSSRASRSSVSSKRTVRTQKSSSSKRATVSSRRSSAR
jgi:hypothetical protein